MVQLVDSFFKNLMVFDWTGTVAISIYITLGLVNILAHILNRKTECVILWGWWDVTLIFITVMSPISIYVWLQICTAFELSKEWFIWGMVLCITVPMLICFVTSVVRNWGYGKMSVLYIMVSILTKVVLLIFGPIIALAWFFVKDSGNSAVKDARYRDGTKNNKKTKQVGTAVALFVLLFYPLVFSFIKPKEKADSIKYKLKKLAGIC